MKQIELYTEQEQEFLSGVLRLLEIEYTTTLNKNPIGAVVFSFNPTNTELVAITSMMRANYQKIIMN